MLLLFLAITISFFFGKQGPSRCEKSRANWIVNVMLICFPRCWNRREIQCGVVEASFHVLRSFYRVFTPCWRCSYCWSPFEQKWNGKMFPWSTFERSSLGPPLKLWQREFQTEQNFWGGKFNVPLSLIFAKCFRLPAVFPHLLRLSLEQRVIDKSVSKPLNSSSKRQG